MRASKGRGAMSPSPMTDLNAMARAGGEALNRGDPRSAKPLFEQVVASRPTDIGAWYGLALACRGVGDADGLILSVDRVLAVEPAHLPALILKADHFAASGDGRAAESFYRAVVTRAPPLDRLPPELRQEVHRAERLCADFSRAFETHMREAVAAAGFDPTRSSRRFAQSLDLLLGAKTLFLQAPTSYYFPELAQRQFYERDEFSWAAELEANTARIRAELMGVLAGEEAFSPYVQSTSERPAAEFGDLRDNPKWAAYYLIEGGEVVSSAAERCPRTLAAVSATPLCRSPGRTPSVLYSRLSPGARIPPHHGQINARLICHLPLIVPPSCGLRVGNEVRPWVEGELLIFDDSIEHEAWNDSDQTRVVLLFEIWRPELTEEEQRLVSATLASVGSYRAD
jgi:aspartate beta-hydroxylase